MVGVVILVVGGLYLAACVWVAQRLTARIASGLARVIAVTGLAAIFMVLPHIDAIWGHAHFNRYCAQESKSEIYGKLALPRRMFDSQERPSFLDRNGNIEWSSIASYAMVKFEVDNEFRGIKNLKRDTILLIRVSDGAVIARRVNIHYAGGWFRTNGEGIGADSCIAEPSSDTLLRTLLTIEK
jgi:hypothetical protein